jgi:hypothetical protein
VLVIPFPVVCGMSHNSSRFEIYGLTKIGGPSYVGLKPKKVKEVKVLEIKKDYLNNKVK